MHTQHHPLSLFSLPLLLLLTGLWACQPSEAKEQPATSGTVSEATTPRAIPVEVAPLAPLDERRYLQTSGMVASREEARLSFTIGGVVTKVYVEAGDPLGRGQLLAKLNPTEINAQVAQAQSALDKAARDRARAERLYRDTVITYEQVQNLQTAEEVAQAQLEAAQFNQQRSMIYAPTSGKVLQKLAESGEIVSPGTPILLVAYEGKGQVVRVALTDREVVQVQLGDSASLRFDAWPGQAYAAEVSQIAAMASPGTGTYEVELSFTSPARGLKNGFVGHARIFPRQQTSWRKVPMNAVVEVQQGHLLVFHPDDSLQHAQARLIHTYRIGDDHVAVPSQEVSDLAYVIAEGAKYLKAKTPIRVVNADYLDSLGDAQRP